MIAGGCAFELGSRDGDFGECGHLLHKLDVVDFDVDSAFFGVERHDVDGIFTFECAATEVCYCGGGVV